MVERFVMLFDRKKIYIIAVVALILSAVGIGLFAFKAPTYKVEKVIRGDIAAIIEASGTIRSKQSVELVWNTNGVVKMVAVKVGESIKTDQVLAELDTNTTDKSILLAKSNLIQLEQEMERVSLPGLAVSRAWNEYVTAKHKTEDAQVYYDSLVSKRSGTELLEDIDDEITDGRDQVRRLEDFFKTYYEHLADTNPRKLEMIVRITQAKQNVIDLIGRYNWFNGYADPDIVEMAVAELNIAKANEADKEREYLKLKTDGNIEEIAKVQARMNAANSTIMRAKLISPINGNVTAVDLLVGDTVKSGQISIRVDDLSAYQVDIFISEVDIPNIAVGQVVELTSEVVAGKTFAGKVVSIDQAGRMVDGVMAYKVKIEFDKVDEKLKPGMSVEIVINLERSSLALLVPTQAIRFVDGSRVVFVLRNNQAVPVIIRVGTITSDLTQVVGGNISEGENVILDPPSVQNLDLALLK